MKSSKEDAPVHGSEQGAQISKAVSSAIVSEKQERMYTPAAIDPRVLDLLGSPPVGPYSRPDLSLCSFPAELIALPQWGTWKFGPPQKPGGKPRKIPINPRTGYGASSTDLSAWGTFDEAVARFKNDLEQVGLGFVLSAEDPFVFVDLDHCREIQTGIVELWAEEILEEFRDTYIEVSSGLDGFHILARGSLAGLQGRKIGAFEIYESRRYVALTGWAL